MNSGVQGIGVPFFSETEWKKVKAAAVDSATFHDTYAEFVHGVANAERHYRAQGVPIVRVNVTLEALAAWCKSTGRQIDAKARADYAAIGARLNDK